MARGEERGGGWDRGLEDVARKQTGKIGKQGRTGEYIRGRLEEAGDGKTPKDEKRRQKMGGSIEG